MQMVLLLATVAQVALRADMIVENSGGRVQELPLHGVALQPIAWRT